MLYTVEKAAIQLNVSKQSIYVKLKMKDYKDKVIKKAGKTYIDSELLTLIQDNLKVKSNMNTEPQAEAEKAQDTIIDQNTVNINQELVKALLDQLKTKDQQIDEKDNQINDLHRLIENNQVLLKEKPQQNILLLEEHFQDLDTKLEEVKSNMAERKEQQNKGFFSKMFKK